MGVSIDRNLVLVLQTIFLYPGTALKKALDWVFDHFTIGTSIPLRLTTLLG